MLISYIIVIVMMMIIKITVITIMQKTISTATQNCWLLVLDLSLILPDLYLPRPLASSSPFRPGGLAETGQLRVLNCWLGVLGVRDSRWY